MRKFLTWLKSILRWLVEWWWGEFFCCLVVLSPVFISFLGAGEAAFRYTGMVLQLLGIGEVAWGINATRKEFDLPSVFAVWRERLNHFPPFGGQVLTGSVHITLPSNTINARDYSLVVAGVNSTIDERVQALEDSLKRVNDRVSQTQNEIDQEFRKQYDALKQEQQDRSNEDQGILEKIESIETGGLQISAIGALCLFFGVFMSAIPSEFAGFMNNALHFVQNILWLFRDKYISP